MSAAGIARRLGGGGPYSSGWHRAHCPNHNSASNSLALKDGATGLAIKCHAGCSRADVLAALTHLGLVDPGSPDKPAPDPEELTRRREIEAANRKHRTANALDMWSEGVDASDTVVETYLWSRLCCISPPPTIHLHRSLYHRETGQRRPAMMGLVEHVDYGPVAVHATYLRPTAVARPHSIPCARSSDREAAPRCGWDQSVMTVG